MSGRASVREYPAVAHPFAGRVASLTPREVRILLLAMEGEVDRGVVAETLGISAAAVANAVASVRRKLSVPHRQDLRTFAYHTDLRTLVRDIEPAAMATAEPRRRDLLRLTINELERLLGSTQQRAERLGTVADADPDGVVADEARKLTTIASSLERALAEALRIARTTA